MILDSVVTGPYYTDESTVLWHGECVQVEREADYLPLIEQRIRRAKAQGHQPDLFGGAA